MPNRIIKESICTSENIDRLTEFEEITFYRLIVNVDDYGRLDARPKLIAARLFPLKDVKVNKVEDALFALAEAELIDLYKVGGKPYLQMRTWANHQTIRNKRSKYPGIDDAEHENEKEQNEDTCKQLQADASKCPRNPIQSNPNMNPNPNPDSTEQFTAHVPPVPPVYTLPLNDGTEWGLSQEQYNEYVSLYPAVDVMSELRKMRGWLSANPERRKTKRGINSFVNRWLSKEQDRAKNPGTAPKKPQTRFHNFEERQDDSDEEMALAMMRNRLK